jgi:hypothetical protein
MLKLEEIVEISKQERCYCGRKLIGEFCPEHGNEIRLAPVMITARFSLTEGMKESAEEKNFEEPILVTLPYNQFRGLFKKRDLEKIIPIKESYLLKLTFIEKEKAIEELLKDLLEQIDTEPFFGKTLIHRQRIRSSGITIYFLMNNTIIDNKTMKVTFEAVYLRRLIDYISWRLNHFQATRENIQKSLKTTRAMIQTKEGEYYRIEEVDWKMEKKLPSKITIRATTELEHKNKAIPSELYHNRDYFHLGSRTERRTFYALNGLARKFNRMLKPFFEREGIMVETERTRPLEDYTKLETFCGKTITLKGELLEVIKEQIRGLKQ